MLHTEIWRQTARDGEKSAAAAGVRRLQAKGRCGPGCRRQKRGPQRAPTAVTASEQRKRLPSSHVTVPPLLVRAPAFACGLLLNQCRPQGSSFRSRRNPVACHLGLSFVGRQEPQGLALGTGGMQNGADSPDDSLAVSHKTQRTLTAGPGHHAPRRLHRDAENLCPHRTPHRSV